MEVKMDEEKIIAGVGEMMMKKYGSQAMKEGPVVYFRKLAGRDPDLKNNPVDLVTMSGLSSHMLLRAIHIVLVEDSDSVKEKETPKLYKLLVDLGNRQIFVDAHSRRQGITKHKTSSSETAKDIGYIMELFRAVLIPCINEIQKYFAENPAHRALIPHWDNLETQLNEFNRISEVINGI